MSKINDLIKELCPNGVEYKKLSDICLAIKGQGLAKSDKGLGGEPIILYGELYTKYKTSPNEKEREQARKKYLDKVGMHEDFRW